jgi:hypothetical protein
MLIKFHFFKAEQLICSADMALSDHNSWNQIVPVCATLEILGCSNLQILGAMFLCPEIHSEM